MNNPFKEYAVSFVINEDHSVANDNASKCNGGQKHVDHFVRNAFAAAIKEKN